jgi:hypothetical protein
MHKAVDDLAKARDLIEESERWPNYEHRVGKLVIEAPDNPDLIRDLRECFRCRTPVISVLLSIAGSVAECR